MNSQRHGAAVTWLTVPSAIAILILGWQLLARERPGAGARGDSTGSTSTEPPRSMARSPAPRSSRRVSPVPSLLASAPTEQSRWHEGRPHAHPITPEHERLSAERSIIARLDAALDARDSAGMRAGLNQYRREFPEDGQRLQAGYEVIASCLEDREAARSSAEQFYAHYRASTLRRWVRRLCLEP